MRWSEQEIELGGQTFSARDHVPVLITANPVNPLRYVVVNSGHTFGAPEFRRTNALLFPHLGDFAVFSVDSPGNEPKVSGYFNEEWESN